MSVRSRVAWPLLALAVLVGCATTTATGRSSAGGAATSAGNESPGATAVAPVGVQTEKDATAVPAATPGIPTDIAAVIPAPVATPSKWTLVVLSIRNKEDGTEMAFDFAEVARATGFFKEVRVGDDPSLGDFVVTGEWSVQAWPAGRNQARYAAKAAESGPSTMLATVWDTRTSVSLKTFFRGRKLDTHEVKDVPAREGATELASKTDVLEPVYRELRRQFLAVISQMVKRRTGAPLPGTPLPADLIARPKGQEPEPAATVPSIAGSDIGSTPAPAVERSPSPVPGGAVLATGPDATAPDEPAGDDPRAGADTLALARPPDATPSHTVPAAAGPVPVTSPRAGTPAIRPVSHGLYATYFGGVAFGLHPSFAAENGDELGFVDGLAAGYRGERWLLAGTWQYARFHGDDYRSMGNTHRNAFLGGVVAGYRPTRWLTVAAGVDGGIFQGHELREDLLPGTGVVEETESGLFGTKLGALVEIPIARRFLIGGGLWAGWYTIAGTKSREPENDGMISATVTVGFGR